MAIQEVNTALNPNLDPKAEAAKVKKACAEFEALFIAQMLKTMRSANSVLTEEEKQDGLGLGTENPYQDMFDWELAMKLSMGSPLGIAEQLGRKYAEQTGQENPLEATPETKSLRKYFAPASRKPAGEPTELDGIVARAAKRHGLDENLLRAVIQTESAGNPRAVSPKGAKGLMQLMDSTAADLGVDNPFDPSENVTGGAAYLRKLLDRYEGNRKLALAAYNAGPGAVDRHGGIPPYPETVSYVRKVLQQMSRAETAQPAPKPHDKEK